MFRAALNAFHSVVAITPWLAEFPEILNLSMEQGDCIEYLVV